MSKNVFPFIDATSTITPSSNSTQPIESVSENCSCSGCSEFSSINETPHSGFIYEKSSSQLDIEGHTSQEAVEGENPRNVVSKDIDEYFRRQDLEVNSKLTLLNPYNITDNNQSGQELPTIPNLRTERFSLLKGTELLDNYLKANLNIRRAMVWGFGEDAWKTQKNMENNTLWREFDRWDSDTKRELFYKFSEMERNVFRFQLNPWQVDFSLSEIKEAYLSYTAHALWLDVHKIFPWRLSNYSNDQLRWIFHAQYFAAYAKLSPDPAIPANSRFVFGYLEKKETDWWKGERKYAVTIANCNPVSPVDTYQKTRSILDTNLDSLRLLTSSDSIVHPPEQFFEPRVAGTINDLSFYMTPEGVSLSTQSKAKQALRTLSSWFMVNLTHGSTSKSWSSIWKNGSKGMLRLYPSVGMILNIPVTTHWANYLRSQIKLPASSDGQVFPNYEIPKGRTVQDLINSRGEVACNWNRKEIKFTTHCAYSGCHTAAGLMYWMLRSINIPSKVLATFLGSSYYGNYWGYHKGIEVHIDKQDIYSIMHMDELYIPNTVGNINGEAVFLDFLDPYYDFLNLFLNKKQYDLWFGRFHPSERTFDTYAFRTLAAAGVGASSPLLISYWETKEDLKRSFSPQYVPWVRLMNDLKPTIPFFEKLQVISRATQMIETRISEIKRGKNTMWGNTLHSFKRGYNLWLNRRGHHVVKSILM